ncbi:MAG: hypothetical protein S0880_24590 [Actinomycetota bacterium]|nr:hypothetical protein [Actinomycetota bacterium]
MLERLPTPINPSRLLTETGPGAFRIVGDPLPRLNGRSVLGRPEIAYWGPFGPMVANAGPDDEVTTVTGPELGAASLAWGPGSARSLGAADIAERLAEGITAAIGGFWAVVHTAGHRPGPCVPLRVQMEDRWLRMRFCGARGPTLEREGSEEPLITCRPSRVSAAACPQDVALWLLVRASRLAWDLGLHPTRTPST